MRITFGSDTAKLVDIVAEAQNWLDDIRRLPDTKEPAAIPPAVAQFAAAQQAETTRQLLKEETPPAPEVVDKPATSAVRVYTDEELKTKVNEFSAVIGMTTVRLVMQAHGAARLSEIKDRGAFLEACYIVQQHKVAHPQTVYSLPVIKTVCGL